MKIILASTSPRRKELIKLLFDNFECVAPVADENAPHNIPPKELPTYLATQKALSVAKNFQNDIVIGCDTLVFLEDKILTKPKDEEDAKNMLSSLSGKVHEVITGCCLCLKGKSYTFSDSTMVEFYPLTPQEINEYVATGEPLDKAGAYGIQVKGALLVKAVYGDYFNVVGLPIAKLKREIEIFKHIM